MCLQNDNIALILRVEGRLLFYFDPSDENKPRKKFCSESRHFPFYYIDNNVGYIGYTTTNLYDVHILERLFQLFRSKFALFKSGYIDFCEATTTAQIRERLIFPIASLIGSNLTTFSADLIP